MGTNLFEIIDRVPEEPDPGSLDRKSFALAFVFLSEPGPVGVIRKMVERFRMGHQPGNSARHIADSGDVFHRSVRIERKLAPRRFSVRKAIAKDNLPLPDQTIYNGGLGKELTLTVAHRQFDIFYSAREHAVRKVSPDT